jgi:hypothetical protein
VDPQARTSFGAAITDVAIPAQIGLKLFDNDPQQTRRKRISNLPRQKLIMRDLNFLLSELALCHELCPPTTRRRGYTIVSLKFSDHFLWFLNNEKSSQTIERERAIEPPYRDHPCLTCTGFARMPEFTKS